MHLKLYIFVLKQSNICVSPLRINISILVGSSQCSQCRSYIQWCDIIIRICLFKWVSSCLSGYCFLSLFVLTLPCIRTRDPFLVDSYSWPSRKNVPFSCFIASRQYYIIRVIWYATLLCNECRRKSIYRQEAFQIHISFWCSVLICNFVNVSPFSILKFYQVFFYQFACLLLSTLAYNATENLFFYWIRVAKIFIFLLTILISNFRQCD